MSDKENQSLKQSATESMADDSGQAFLDNQFENLRITSIFLFPLVAFVAFRAQNILFFFSKEALEILTLPFQIIVWAIILIYYDIFLIGITGVLNKKWIIFSSLVIGTISYIPLNFYLTPRYGLVGLCTTIVINLAIMFIFTVFFLTKVSIKLPLYKTLEKPVIATMAITLILHYTNTWPFSLAFLASAAGYFVTFAIITVLDK